MMRRSPEIDRATLHQFIPLLCQLIPVYTSLYQFTPVYASLHQFTWFTVEGVEGVAHSRKGSRAGCSTGDLLFSVAFAHACRKIHDILLRKDLITSVEIPPNMYQEWYGDTDLPTTLVFKDASWADDNGFPVVAPASTTLPYIYPPELALAGN